MAESKGKYAVHFTVDTILVRCLSGAFKVKAKDAEQARERAFIKLAKMYADLTRIELSEVYKVRVPGYEPEEED